LIVFAVVIFGLLRSALRFSEAPDSVVRAATPAGAEPINAPSAGGLGAMVNAVKPRPAPPPPLAAGTGDVQLNGLYLQLDSIAIGGRVQFSFHYYYFMPDGHVFTGIPPGGTVRPQPAAEDIAVMQKTAPKSLGVYKVSGDKIAIQYPGGKPEVHTFAFAAPGKTDALVLDNVFAVQQSRFKDNETFNAKYSTSFGSDTGGRESRGGGDRIQVSSFQRFEFHADGSFSGASAVDLGVTSKTLDSGSGSKDADGGKYQISGNTLTLRHAGGKTEMLTVTSMPGKDESPPERMMINGSIYNLEK
jgi:hypothetical protein